MDSILNSKIHEEAGARKEVLETRLKGYAKWDIWYIASAPPPHLTFPLVTREYFTLKHKAALWEGLGSSYLKTPGNLYFSVANYGNGDLIVHALRNTWHNKDQWWRRGSY